MKSRRQREQTQSHSKDNKIRNRALLLGSITIILLFVLMLFTPVVLAAHGTGLLECGQVRVSAEMTSSAYNGGSLVYDENPNSPLYVAGQQVDAFDITLTISAIGNFVDWSTLAIDATLKAQASGEISEVMTFDTMGDGLSKTAGGYSGSSSYMVENPEDYLSGNPDEVLADGTGIYYLVFFIEISASITDTNAKTVEDLTSVRTVWRLENRPSGVSAGVESSGIPKFTTTPNPSYAITEGDSLVLKWVGVDDNPASYEIRAYTIYDGSQLKASGSWTNTTRPQYDVGTFRSSEPGDYEVSISCKLIDADGQTAISTSYISVIVPTTPAIHFEKATDNPTTAERPGPVEIMLMFKPRSDNPSSYQVFQNGAILQEGSWPGGDLIIEVSYLYPGANLFRCVVFDTAGYSATYQHTITVSADPYRDIGPIPTSRAVVNSPFGGDALTMSLWVAFGVLAVAAVVYIFRWWRNE